MKKLIFFFLTLFLVSSLYSNPSIFDEEYVVGMIDGKEIKLRDLESKQINDLKQGYYKSLLLLFKSQVIKQKIEKNPELLPNIEVTEKEASIFYIQKKLTKQGSFPELKEQIINFIKTQRKTTLYNKLYDEQIENDAALFTLKEPKQWISKLKLAKELYRSGDDKAQVMIIEFSDYQCPYCKRVQPILQELMSEYNSKVAFIFKHLPLNIHNEAENAALAAECSEEQKSFAQYHALLFENARSLNEALYLKLAKEANIKDIAQFEKCISSKKYLAKVNNDANDANNLGINGTPGFLIGRYNKKNGFVQGEIISGVTSKEHFKSVIERYLSKG